MIKEVIIMNPSMSTSRAPDQYQYLPLPSPPKRGNKNSKKWRRAKAQFNTKVAQIQAFNAAQVLPASKTATNKTFSSKKRSQISDASPDYSKGKSVVSFAALAKVTLLALATGIAVGGFKIIQNNESMRSAEKQAREAKCSARFNELSTWVHGNRDILAVNESKYAEAPWSPTEGNHLIPLLKADIKYVMFCKETYEYTEGNFFEIEKLAQTCLEKTQGLREYYPCEKTNIISWKRDADGNIIKSSDRYYINTPKPCQIEYSRRSHKGHVTDYLSECIKP